MPPTPTVQNSPDKRIPRPLGGTADRRSDLVTRVKYCNTLPDLPFDPKFIAYPFGHSRFVTYSTTSLEKGYIYEVLTEPDLGVDVELVIPNAYNLPANNPSPHLDPKDERLLEDDLLPQKNQKRSRHHAKSVSWLRRTEYISTEQTRFQPQTIDKVEAKVGYSIKKSMKEEMHYMDRESQIKNIEKTFEDAMEPIESHFSKPGVVPVEILPVFPDYQLWKYPCAQVIFDSDPAPVGRPIPAQLEEMSQAMIRGVMDESGEQFVAYFLPSEETLNKRKRDVDASKEYEEDEVYEYRMAREYNWNVKSKATKGYEENYFFVIRDEGVFYNELETRVRLNKRRTRGPHQQLNTKLCVKHIPLATVDYKFQRNREKELEPMQEEEEEKSEDEKSDEKSDAEEGNKTDHGEEEEEDLRSDIEIEPKEAAAPTPQKRSIPLGSLDTDSDDDSDSGKEKDKSPKASPTKSRPIISDNEGDSSDAAGSKKGGKRSASGSGSSSSSKSDSSAASDSD